LKLEKVGAVIGWPHMLLALGLHLCLFSAVCMQVLLVLSWTRNWVF